jgi:hypothetical protein
VTLTCGRCGSKRSPVSMIHDADIRASAPRLYVRSETTHWQLPRPAHGRLTFGPVRPTRTHTAAVSSLQGACVTRRPRGPPATRGPGWVRPGWLPADPRGVCRPGPVMQSKWSVKSDHPVRPVVVPNK